MKKLLMSFAIILWATLFLFLYSDDESLLSENLLSEETILNSEFINELINTYSFPYKYITTINVNVSKLSFKIYLDNDLTKIKVKTENSSIKSYLKDNSLYIEARDEKICHVDIYIPDRIYIFYFNTEYLELKSNSNVKEVININSNELKMEMEHYCGSIDIQANSGWVDLRKSSLQENSYVNFTMNGNIFLDVRFMDSSEKYLFVTEEGIIKINNENLSDRVLFDIYAIATFGEYNDVNKNNFVFNKNEYAKVELKSNNGLVSFEN